MKNIKNFLVTLFTLGGRFNEKFIKITIIIKK